MNGAFSNSVRTVVLDGDIGGACRQAGYRERTGFAGSDVDRRVPLELRDAAVADGCGKVVGVAGGTVGHVDDQRFADTNCDGFFRAAAAFGGDINRVAGGRIDGRGTAVADRQMDGAFSGVRTAVGVAVLDGDIDGACSQTGYRERTGAAGSDVDRRVPLELRDAAAAEGCGKVICAVGGAVGHVDDQRFADSNLDGFRRIIRGRGNVDRGAVGGRIDGRGTAAADRQMDGAFSGVRTAVRVAVLDGDIDGACRQTGYRERTGAAGCNVDRRVPLELRDAAAAAEGCGKVICAGGGAVGHVDDQRFADTDLDGFRRIIRGRGDTDRVAHNRRIHDRRIFGDIIAADNRSPDTVGFCYIGAGSITISKLQGSGIIGGGN